MTKPGQKKHPKSAKGCAPTTLPITLALITLIGTFVTAMFASPAFNTWVQSIIKSDPTSVLPTATPIPFARIQSLDVIQDGTLISTVNPGNEILLSTGSSMIFQVNVITKTNPDELVFRWEFCRTENNSNTIGQGAIEIPYKISEEGVDCIKVKIERGGQYLDTANFQIRTENSQP